MQCQSCRRNLAEGEPIYRVSTGYGLSWYQRFGGAIGLQQMRGTALALVVLATG